MSSSQSEYQSSGMLSRGQLLHLFNRFSDLTSQPDVKKRIADAVNDNQEAVAVTTAIQEEILLEMGVDPRFGLACLGKVNMAYENDRDLMVHFYGFIAKEEMACEEAELGPDKFAERMQMQQKLHEEQLEMLKHMRNFHLDDQSAILEKFCRVMAAAAMSLSLVGAFKGLSLGSSSSSSCFKGDFGSIHVGHKVSVSFPLQCPLTIEKMAEILLVEGLESRFMVIKSPSLVPLSFASAEPSSIQGRMLVLAKTTPSSL